MLPVVESLFNKVAGLSLDYYQIGKSFFDVLNINIGHRNSKNNEMDAL